DGHQIKEIDAIEEETELIGRSGALPEILERDIDGEEVARLSPEERQKSFSNVADSANRDNEKGWELGKSQHVSH
ncbi:unnamed protein product, partial [Symbiodinium pilosum]